MTSDTKLGVLALLEAQKGKGEELVAFLDRGRDLAAAEEGTVTWYAFRHSETGFGIFDTFETVDARQGRSRLLVATAAADIGNLRFYQRVGFRMRSVERDAFTPATGYEDGLEIDGIRLRDRVWLDLPLATDG